MVVAGKRNPDLTRENLLRAAFQEIHRNGFRAASLDSILADAQVTKGALYHHFSNKKALGYAVVDELIRHGILDRWVRPLEGAKDPIDWLLRTLRETEIPPHVCELGCPLNNLAQEMAPVDEGFRQRVEEIFRLWRAGLAEALKRGQDSGRVRADIHPEKAATFIVGALEGAVGMAKNAQSPELLYDCLEGLTHYIASLRSQQLTSQAEEQPV